MEWFFFSLGRLCKMCQLSYTVNLLFPDFAKVCEQSTDFHFPDLEKQFEKIEFDVIRANEWRNNQKQADEGDKVSIKSSGSSSSEVSGCVEIVINISMA